MAKKQKIISQAEFKRLNSMAGVTKADLSKANIKVGKLTRVDAKNVSKAGLLRMRAKTKKGFTR